MITAVMTSHIVLDNQGGGVQKPGLVCCECWQGLSSNYDKGGFECMLSRNVELSMPGEIIAITMLLLSRLGQMTGMGAEQYSLILKFQQHQLPGHVADSAINQIACIYALQS